MSINDPTAIDINSKRRYAESGNPISKSSSIAFKNNKLKEEIMNKEERIKHLQEIMRIPSENDNEIQVAKYYQKLLEEHGIESKLVEYSPTRQNLIAEIKGENPGKDLGFNGHMEVVEAGKCN